MKAERIKRSVQMELTITATVQTCMCMLLQCDHKNNEFKRSKPLNLRHKNNTLSLPFNLEVKPILNLKGFTRHFETQLF